MFGFVYIQITKSYESLQSEHSLEYMPKTWTEVDEGKYHKECDAASQTASTMAPGPSSTSCNAALNGGTCAGQHDSTPATSRGPSAASTTSHTDAARVASSGTSRTDAERPASDETSRTDATGLANDEEGTHVTHEALRGDQVGSRLGTDENDEEFDDENYKRLDPRSALGVVAERVSCRVWLPVLPPRNVAHAGMYLGEIRLRLMAAKDRKNPTFKAQILRDGGWVRKPAIATMTTDDIIEKNTCGGGQFLHAYTCPPPHASGRVSQGKIALQERTR